MVSHDFEDNIWCLMALKLLKVLKFNFQSERIDSIMKVLAESNIPIQHLRLYNGKIDIEAIDHISKLKQIKIF